MNNQNVIGEKLKQLDKRLFYAIDLEISDILFNRGENI